MLKTYIACIALIIVASANMALAGEFDCQPPIVIETKKSNNFSKALLDAQIAEIMRQEGKPGYTKPQTGENVEQNPQADSDLIGPLFYLEAGVQSDERWFDRRLNWTNYGVTANFEYDFVGLYVEGAGSDVGRDEFEIFDAQATLYFFMSGRSNPQDPIGWRIGGGLTYFYSDPLHGQAFLQNRRGAAFIDAYFDGFEAKFVGLYDEDDFWGGALYEFKYVNPFFTRGLSATSAAGAFLNPLSALMLGLMFVLPTEYGITGAFGLPDGGDDWGWFLRWKYPFVITYERLPHSKLRSGFYWGVEFYWGYQAGFTDSNRISQGWEVGLRVFVFAF